MASMVLVMAASCHWGSLSYSASASVPQQWTRMDTVEFRIPAPMGGAAGYLTAGRDFQFVVDIRYTGKYPYRDLWLLLRHNVTDSLNWQTDTLRCPLFSEGGHPLGKGLTDLYAIDVPYATLAPDGDRQVCVQLIHCMADDSLRGITDVGIRVQSGLD